MKQNRRQSRENAFLLLFEWAFHADTPADLLRRAWEGREVEADDFCRELVTRAIEGIAELDGIITGYSNTYKIERLSKVTLAVLRVAFCEMTLMEDIPLGATINEAVELCKKYAGDDEAAYVNGMLGQYGRDRTAGTLRAIENTPAEDMAAPPIGADRAKALAAYQDKQKAAEERAAKRKPRADKPFRPKTEQSKRGDGRPYQVKTGQIKPAAGKAKPKPGQGKSAEGSTYKGKPKWERNKPDGPKASRGRPGAGAQGSAKPAGVPRAAGKAPARYAGSVPARDDGTAGKTPAGPRPERAHPAPANAGKGAGKRK